MLKNKIPQKKGGLTMEAECRAAFDKMRAELDALDAVSAVSCGACGQSWDCHFEDVCMVPVPDRFKNKEEEEIMDEAKDDFNNKKMEGDRVNDERQYGEEDFSNSDAWCQKCFQQLARHNAAICETSQELYKSFDALSFKGAAQPPSQPKESLDEWTRRRRRSIAKGRARRRP